MKTEKNNVTLEYAGTDGNVSVSVYSSSVNEGVDTSVQFVISTTDGTKSETITVNREGRREKFNASDGAFLTSDGSTFNVVKAIFSNGI